MLAFRRLSQVFGSSKEIPISNRSRIVFMSDCHRGDGSRADDFSPNKRLYLYALWNATTEQVTLTSRSETQTNCGKPQLQENSQGAEDVFLLLRRFHVAKRLYVIWGNHDIAKRSKQYLSQNLYYRYDPHTRRRVRLLEGLESHEGLILRHRESNVRVFVVHGHQADFANDQLWPLACTLARYVWRPLEIIGIQDPISPAKNHKKRNRIESVLEKWSRDNHQIVIAGHTHRPTFLRRRSA